MLLQPKKIEPILVTLCLIALLLVILPVLHTTYLGDDAFNSYLFGWIGYNRATPWQTYAMLYDGTNLATGRFYPLYPALVLILFTTVRSLAVVKILQVFTILVNAMTFYALARRIGAGRGGALCALAVLPLCFEFREFNDAILQFSLHFPLTVEFVLLALLAAERYSALGSRRSLVAAEVWWLAAALLYDGVYALVVTFVAIARLPAARTRCGTLIGIALGVTGALVLAALLERMTHPGITPGYQVRLGSIAVSTYAAQVAAAIPLTYYATDPSRFFPGTVELWKSAGALSLETVAAFVAALAIGFTSFWSFATDRIQAARVVWTGAALWLLPGVLLALATRYQNQIRFGLGHTPVYIEAYGVALIAGFATSRVFVRWKASVVPAALALAFVYGTNVAANAVTLTRYSGWDHSRRLLSAALQAGVLRDAPTDAVLYVDRSTPINGQFGAASWDPRFFYFMETAKRYDVRPIEREETEVIPAHSYDLRMQSSESSFGDVIVSVLKVRSAPGKDTLIASAAIFEQRSRENRPARVGSRFEPRDFRVTGRSTEGTLFGFTSACRYLPVEALPGNSPAPVALAWGDGFSVAERDAESTWHWAGPAGILRLSTVAPRPVRTTLRLRLLDGTSRASHASVTAAGRRFPVRLTRRPQAFNLPIDVDSGRPVEVLFQTDAPRVTAPGDSRDLRMQVRDAYLSGRC